jgi:hypothetical protein
MLGDSVLAEGNFETIGGVRFLSAHSSTVQKALATSTLAGQPDYLFLEEVGYEAPPYQNQRLIALLIGFTTLANPATDVDLWSLHRDPVSNAIHEFPFATVRGCDAAAGAGTCSNQGLVGAGANIFKIRYDIDFLIGPQPKLSPCAHLTHPLSRFASTGICSGTGNATTKDIAVMSPVPHEIIARTGRKIDDVNNNPPNGTLVTIDINGNEATNGEYLFPLGLNLGGLGVAEMSEVNINELNTPIPFEGIPWNLDRRLGPSGCLNTGGCEGGAIGTAGFALDPFPYSGLDPRTQASLFPASAAYSDPVLSPTTLTNSRNRMFAYVLDANGIFVGGTNTLPYALGVFPPIPGAFTINPTPPLNIVGQITVAPTLVGPSGAVGTATPTYTWSAVPNATGYTFFADLNGGITTSYTPAAAGCATGTGNCSVTPAAAISVGVNVGWIVNAVNAAGPGPWSPPNFIVLITAPAAPTLVGPSGTIATATPIFTWNAVPNATSYTLFTDANGGITTTYTAAVAGCAAGTGTCSAIIPGVSIPAGVPVGWTVNAVNVAGTSPWSAPSFFVVNVPTAPATPTLVSPSGAVATATPTFTWNAVANATFYTLFRDDTGVSTNFTAVAAGCAAGTGTCSVTPTTVTANGVAVGWVVNATGIAGTSDWSAPIFFIFP